MHPWPVRPPRLAGECPTAISPARVHFFAFALLLLVAFLPRTEREALAEKHRRCDATGNPVTRKKRSAKRRVEHRDLKAKREAELMISAKRNSVLTPPKPSLEELTMSVAAMGSERQDRLAFAFGSALCIASHSHRLTLTLTRLARLRACTRVTSDFIAAGIARRT